MTRRFLLIAGALVGFGLLIHGRLAVDQPRRLVATAGDAPKIAQSAEAPHSGPIWSAGRREEADPADMWLARKVAELDQVGRAATFEQRATLFQDFVDEIAEGDLPETFNALMALQNQNPSSAGRELQMRLLQRWANFDPRAVSETVVQVRPEDRAEACERLGAVWARQSFDDAAKWIDKLDGAERQGAVLAIVNEVASERPREALALASRITIPPEKREVVARAAAVWAASDPEAAAKWAEQIQEPSLYEPVLAAMAVALADKNPTDAARLLINSIPAGRIQQNAVLGIMQRLAFRDPTAAGAWAAQFPEELRATALAELNRISERRH